MSGAWVMQKLCLQRTCFRVCISLLLPRHDLESSLADTAFGSTSWPSTLFRRLSHTVFPLSFSKGLKDHHEGLPSDQFHQSQSCWPEPTNPEAAFHHITQIRWVLGEQEPELATCSMATDFRLHQRLERLGTFVPSQPQSCSASWK